jgi:hypothetical protein
MLTAMDLHSGKWSAMYAFGSSGVLLPESVGRTLWEINKNLLSANLSKSQLKRLQQLRNFIAGHLSTLPNAKLTFATKFVNREMLDYDPQGKTRIRFSLMPHQMSRLADVRTTPIR